jgi:hypothetical protein
MFSYAHLVTTCVTAKIEKCLHWIDFFDARSLAAKSFTAVVFSPLPLFASVQDQ